MIKKFCLVLVFLARIAKNLEENFQNLIENNVHHLSGDLYSFRVNNSDYFSKGYFVLIENYAKSSIKAKLKLLGDGKRLTLPKLAVSFVARIDNNHSRSSELDLQSKTPKNLYKFQNYSKYSSRQLKLQTKVSKGPITISWPVKSENYFFKGFMEDGTAIYLDGLYLELTHIKRSELRSYDKFFMLFSLFFFALAFLLNLTSQFYSYSDHLLVPLCAFPLLLATTILLFKLSPLLYLPVLYHLLILVPFFRQRKEDKNSESAPQGQNSASFRLLIFLAVFMVLLGFKFPVASVMGVVFLAQVTFLFEFCLLEKKEAEESLRLVYLFWVFFQLSGYLNHVLFSFFVFSHSLLEAYRADFLWLYLGVTLVVNGLCVLKRVWPEEVRLIALALGRLIGKVFWLCKHNEKNERF
jgi:hypothetical protein